MWHRQQHALHFFLEAVVDLPRDNAIEVASNGANVRRNRHLVVVQDDQQLLLKMSSLVDPFQRDAACEAAIANDRDNMKVLLGQVASHDHSQGSGNRSRSMSHVKSVIDAFLAAWEAGDAFILPQRMELIAPSRSGSCARKPGVQRPKPIGLLEH